jgi:hypothetical protein
MSEISDAFAIDVDKGRCDGCLDSRKCWVCLGNGRIEDRFGKAIECPACHGTGVCPRCLLPENERPDSGIELGHIPRPRASITR